MTRYRLTVEIEAGVETCDGCTWAVQQINGPCYCDLMEAFCVNDAGKHGRTSRCIAEAESTEGEET